ncbi:hypothetical protein D3C81_665870 [compost metagenome]
MVVHDLEQRCATGIAFKLERLNQLLERQVLMRLSPQHHSLDLLQETDDAHLPVNVIAQHLSVDEAADQALHLGAVTVGDRRADTDVLLTAIALQQQVEACQQQHEQGDVVLAGEAAQALDQRRVKGELMTAATVTGLRRARMIERQFQRGVIITQLVQPVGQLALLLTCFQPAPLPQRVVAVLDRQGRQGWRLFAQMRRIQLAELLDQHIHRPAVRDTMVQGQQQHMLISLELEQGDAHQRPTCQIEGLQRLLLGKLAHLLLARQLRHRRQVQMVNLWPLRRGAYYQPFVRLLDEHAAQGFMTLHQAGECLLQRRHLQRATQAYRTGQVVGRAGWLQLP